MRNKRIHPMYSGSRPIVSGLSNPTCPIMLETRDLLDQARNLLRLMRKVRRSTQRCPTCPGNSNCPTMRHIVHATDAAVRDIAQEWGLEQE